MFIYLMHILDIINHDFLWILYLPLLLFWTEIEAGGKAGVTFGRNTIVCWRSRGLSANPDDLEQVTSSIWALF